MLTFFRKIRKSLIEAGTASKYLLYAIGEILLVMTGNCLQEILEFEPVYELVSKEIFSKVSKNERMPIKRSYPKSDHIYNDFLDQTKPLGVNSFI